MVEEVESPTPPEEPSQIVNTVVCRDNDLDVFTFTMDADYDSLGPHNSPQMARFMLSFQEEHPLKFLAFFTGFQYVAAIKLGWKLVYGEAHDSLKMLSLEALTVFIIACCYIRFGKPLSGVAGLPKAVRLTRDETDKAFHDTAIWLKAAAEEIADAAD